MPDKRFHIAMEEEVFEGLQQIPHGLRKHVIGSLLRALLLTIQKHGMDKTIGAIISGNYKLVPKEDD